MTVGISPTVVGWLIDDVTESAARTRDDHAGEVAGVRWRRDHVRDRGPSSVSRDTTRLKEHRVKMTQKCRQSSPPGFDLACQAAQNRVAGIRASKMV